MAGLHAYSCTPSRVDLWITRGVGPSTTWGTQPARHGSAPIASRTVAYGRTGCTPGGAWVEFDAGAAAQVAATNGEAGINLSLSAANEGSVSSWKRFRSDAVFSVTYDTPPPVPTSVRPRTGSVAHACVVGSGRPTLTTGSVTLTATATDPDADQVQAQFELTRPSGAVDYFKTGYQAASSFAYPVTGIAEGVSTLRARVNDGRVWSAWSGRCEFKVDTTSPAPPRVTSSHWPEGDLSPNAINTVGAFTITAGSSDTVKYEYWVDNGVHTTVNVAAGTGHTFSYSPSQHGTRTLHVKGFDASGRFGQRDYVFLPGYGAIPSVSMWKFNEEPASQPTTVTATRYPEPALGSPAPPTLTVPAGSVVVPDDFEPENRALAIGGTGSYSGASVIRSDYPVTVFGKLTSSIASPATLPQGVVFSQEGANGPAYSLRVVPTADGTVQYEFTMRSSDTAGAEVHRVAAAARWEPEFEETQDEVAITYVPPRDGAPGRLAMYVNDDLDAGTTVAESPISSLGWFSTNEPLHLGSDQGGGARWNGRLDNVGFAQQAMSPSDIRSYLDQTL